MTKHEILVLISSVQKTFRNAYAGGPRNTEDLIVCLSLHLHPYLVYTSSKGFGESAHTHMRRLAQAFVARLCVGNKNIMCWPKYIV